jgi:hypothetical protein
MPESHWINATGKQPRTNVEERVRKLKRKYCDEERRCKGQRASPPVESHRRGSATKVSCNTARRACKWACWLCCDVGCERAQACTVPRLVQTIAQRLVDSCNVSFASAYARHVQATKRTRKRLVKLVADDPEDAADAADAAALEDSEEAYDGDDARRRAHASSGGSAVPGSHEVRTGKHTEGCVVSNTSGPATDASTGRLLTCGAGAGTERRATGSEGG